MNNTLSKVFFRPIAPIAADALADERKNWFAFVARLHKNRTIHTMLGSLAIVGLYSGGLVYLIKFHLMSNFSITVSLHSLLGITLGLLLVIRTNTAYDRWWEGRRLVGALVNTSRNFALKLCTFIPKTETILLQDFAALISSYAIALREHLRNGVQVEELKDLSQEIHEELKRAHHVPNAIAQKLYEEVNTMRKNGVISAEDLFLLDKQLEAFTDIIGGCERIKRSPMPMAYSMHLKTFILIFILTLPLGLIQDYGFLSVPATMLVFYAMAGLELIGEEIEDPFGQDENDIPMDTITNIIRHNVFEILVPNLVQSKA